MNLNIAVQSEVREFLRSLPDNSVNCVVTSPPYYGLRLYDGAHNIWWQEDPNCEHSLEESELPPTKLMRVTDAEREKGQVDPKNPGPWMVTARPNQSGGQTKKQLTNAGSFAVEYEDRVTYSAYCLDCPGWFGSLGLEPTLDQFVLNMVEIFHEVRRVLHPTGTLFLNLGDSFCGSGGAGGDYDDGGLKEGQPKYGRRQDTTMKPKDLMLVPAAVAMALRQDGWFLRDEIIWCLGSTTNVYVRSQKGVMPMTVKDMVRLDISSLELWTGEKWSQVLGWKETESDTGLQIEFRNGDIVTATLEHEWPVNGELLKTSQLKVGHVIDQVQLPDNENGEPKLIPDDIAWLLGVFLADGNYQTDETGLIFSINGQQTEIYNQLKEIASHFGANAIWKHYDGDKSVVRISSRILRAVVSEFIGGTVAKDKHLRVGCWQRSNQFLENLLDGYLVSDGYWNEKNKRYRIGFCRNYSLARDLRTICARLEYQFRLKKTVSIETVSGKKHKSFKGEIRKVISQHRNVKKDSEIISIQKSKGRKYWDIAIADEPHMFALASGILTHNCKSSVMPSSVKDRTTRQTETIWLLTKESQYFWDAEAIKEPLTTELHGPGNRDTGRIGNNTRTGGTQNDDRTWGTPSGMRNARNVWHMNPQPSNWEYCQQCDSLWTGKERSEIRNKLVPSENKQDLVIDPATGKAKAQYVGFNERWRANAPEGRDRLHREREKLSKWCPNCDTDEHFVSHFAAFPEVLVERCLKAGTSEHGVCVDCGTPWERVLEKEYASGGERNQDKQTDFKEGGASHKPGNMNSGDYPTGKTTKTVGWKPMGAWHDHKDDLIKGQRGGDGKNKAAEGWREMQEKGVHNKTVGWKPMRSDQKELKEKQERMGVLGLGAGHGDIYPKGSVYAELKKTVGWTGRCSCGGERVKPAVVLDIFIGSGTSGIVAQRMGRDWIGCDLSEAYVKVANKRTGRDKRSRGSLRRQFRW